MAVHSLHFREALLAVLILKFGAGSKVMIYNRTLSPAVLLAQLTVPTGGGFQRSADGTATLLGMPTVIVANTGTASSADFIDSAGNLLFTATCGTAGANTDVIFTSVSLVASSNFSMQNVTYSFP